MLQPASLCLFCYTLLYLSCADRQVLSASVEQLARSIIETYQQFNVTTQLLYNEKANESVTYTKLNISGLLHDAADNLTKRLFKPRREALEALVKKSEALAQSYNWGKHLTIEDIPRYVKAVEFKETGPNPDERAKRFSKHVNFTFSTVHFPVDLFEGEQSVLKALDWTHGLDALFLENEEKGKSLLDREDYLWQYFGSQEGFVRNYPGSAWPPLPEDQPFDPFDARRRSWYIQGASFPKDVLIMIDTSGSTAGQTLYLMQLTVHALLDSLGEDDFIQVANFSGTERMPNKNTARLGPPCFNSFMQATSFNKNMIMDYVNMLDEPRGQANFTLALEYAYNEFEKFTNQTVKDGNEYGSGCSKIIIILTDGGTEKPERLMHVHDPQRNKYRVFTFAVGRSASPLDAVKWLACQNGGSYAEIPNMAAINKAVQLFSDQMSKVMASAKSHQSLLSSIYRDDWGLGLLTSLTMPVFNRTVESKPNLLGVMAMDISLNEFNKFLPFRELGPLSYTFIINHNGFVVKHPMLDYAQEWNSEPPSIDIVDVEQGKNAKSMGELAQVREQMVNMVAGQTIIRDIGSIFNNLDNPSYFIPYERNYFYRPVAATAYRMGFAHPNVVSKVLLVNSSLMDFMDEVTVLTDLEREEYSITIPQWSYCDFMYKLNNQTTVLVDFMELVKHPNVSCNEDMLRHLLWDATIVKQSNLKSIVESGKALSVTATTAGGLTVQYPNVSAENRFSLQPHYSNPASRRAFSRSKEYLFVADYSKDPVDIPVNSTGPSLTVYKALLDDNDTNPYIYAVVGVTMSHSVLTDLLKDLDKKPTPEGNQEETMCLKHHCYLLDEGGFIISFHNGLWDTVQATSPVGQWLGLVDPSLMRTLFNESGSDSIYQRHKFWDYQATCVYSWLKASSATSIRMPSFAYVLDLLISQWTAALSFISSSLLFSLQQDVDAHKLNFGERNITCTKYSYQYYYSDSALNRTIKYEQEGCIRHVQTVKIELTNLLLVVADEPHQSCNRIKPLDQAPKKIESSDLASEDLSICNRHKRKRKAPSHCYDKDPPPAKCAASRNANISVGSLLLLALIAFGGQRQ